MVRERIRHTAERVRPAARRLAVALALLALPAAIGAQETAQPPVGVDMTSDTWLQVSGITRPGPPRVFDELVVFSYQPPEFARYVAAAFAHEGFRELHTFSVRKLANGEDLFYLAYPVDITRTQLDYRIVVDGVWMVDPNAPQRYRDDRGVPIGRVVLRNRPVYRTPSPVSNDDGTTTFRFSFDIRIAATLETVDRQRISIRSFQDPEIYVVGTFNGWDPFADRLRGPDENGFYAVTRPVPPGEHYYYFLVNGRRVLDPLNDLQGRDLQTGTLVSRITVPARTTQR